jgi:hypothetical protein
MVFFHPRPNEPTAALPESGMLFGNKKNLAQKY